MGTSTPFHTAMLVFYEKIKHRPKSIEKNCDQNGNLRDDLFTKCRPIAYEEAKEIEEIYKKYSTEITAHYRKFIFETYYYLESVPYEEMFRDEHGGYVVVSVDDLLTMALSDGPR